MAEKIAIEVALEGGAQVEQQLADIGQTGSQAFAQTSQAADQATESVSRFNLEAVKSGSEIAKNFADIGLKVVEIRNALQHRGIIRSLLGIASAATKTARAVGLLSPEFALLGTGIAGVTVSLGAAVVAFEAAEKAATKFASGTEKINNTLQTLAATTGKSFDELQRGEAAFEQIGIKAETFREVIAKVGDTLNATDTKDLTKGMKDIVLLVNQIAAGQKGITFADWVTAEDKVKGVSIAMKQAADAGKNATQVLLEFLRSTDLATSIKVGAAFGLSEADVDRVRRVKGDISDLIQRIQGAGVLISPAAAAAFDQMRTSIQNADSAWVRFKQSIDSTIFSSIAASFSSTMNDIKAAALNGAAAVSEALGRAFNAFATPPPGVQAFFQAFGQAAQQAVGIANTAIANFVGGLMRGFGAPEQVIKAIQDRINGVATAAQTAGQAAQESSGMFTQWGTAATTGANTAQAGVQEAATMFTSFGTVAGAAGQKAAQAAQQVQASLSDITWDVISSAGVSAWNALTRAIQSAIDTLLKFIGLKPSGGAPSGAGAPGMAGGGLLGGRGTGTSDSNLAWVSRGEHIMPASVVRRPGVLSFLEALRRGGGIPGYAAGGAVGGLPFASLFNAIDAALRTHAADMTTVVNAIKDSFTVLDNSMINIANQILSAGGNARGGLLGGSGTGTSDSNLAWLSRGEYITPARAVTQPGVLAFLEALRRSGGNLTAVLNGMGRFALGGMVPRMPSFAAGGLAGGSNVTIQFPGLPAIGGLRASPDVVDQLHRAAALAQVRSGGRKPSRYA